MRLSAKSRNFVMQQSTRREHLTAMVVPVKYLPRFLFVVVLFAVFFSGCNIVKTDKKTPTLLKTEEATQAELLNEVNRFAQVNSMRAKMDLKFEDNSFAKASPNDGALTKFRKERYAAANAALWGRLRVFEEGAKIDSENALFDAIGSLIKAQLDLSDRPDDQVKALERAVEITKYVEPVSKLRLDAGTLTMASFCRAQFEHLDWKIQLLERTAMKPAK